jgi:Uma2 family endonuclease
MAEAVPKRMTVEEYLAWAERQPGRHELHGGLVVGMAPERNRHALVKLETAIELRRAVSAAGVGCRVFPDGTAVRVDESTSYEPDVLVHCGAFELDALTVDNPVIVVEVTSPSSDAIDSGSKLAGYLQIESVRHVLIIEPLRKTVLHHARSGPTTFASAIIAEGPLVLDPPGIEVKVGAFFAAL